MNKILIIPSIDIQNRKTVRVIQGIPELNCMDYGDDPVEMAMLFRAENAKCLHIVDFNSAAEHSNKNFDIIKNICKSVIIPVQLGGGIRTLDDAKEVFELGIYRLVIGSLALTNFLEFENILNYFGPLKIIAALDVMGDEMYIRSEQKKTGISPFEFAKRLARIGINRFVVSDIKTTGMMSGPNIKLSKTIGEITKLKITLANGIGGYQDLIDVQNATDYGIDSVIIGRALYENKLSCQKIWRIAESGIFN
ncbi:MAG: 1-(5-phosphoribosyl)-5-[(5-phosphoribosylamino)methylideneamino] imidazole-4-carboxamide isomerase [Ignavibacteriales bacterium]|nr:1-(5-phosphoribosyl)-5-[(5-phosphoribosylamino)methylideneamino] imidazole-4-carboxamide isomerase [Ignavibacteriales bacterium]